MFYKNGKNDNRNTQRLSLSFPMMATHFQNALLPISLKSTLKRQVYLISSLKAYDTLTLHFLSMNGILLHLPFRSD